MNKSEQWQTTINAWKSSGLSQKAFCQNNNLKVHTLHYWLRKLTTSSEANDGFIAFSSHQAPSIVTIQVGHAQMTLGLADVSLLLIELHQAGLLYDPA